MKKIGRISDSMLVKRAGQDKNKRNAALALVKAKFAMLEYIMNETEKIAALKFNPKAKAGMIKSAAQYIPSSWMVRDGEGQKVFKIAESMLMKVFKAAYPKVGKALYDAEGTKVAQLNAQKLFEESLLKKNAAIVNYFKKKSEGDVYNGAADELAANMLSGYSAASGTNDSAVADAGDVLDDEAILAALSGTDADLNDPENLSYFNNLTDVEPNDTMGILEELTKNVEGPQGTGNRIYASADVEGRVDAILTKAEQIMKRAEGGIADPIPVEPSKEDSAAQEAVKDTDKTLATEKSIGEGVAMDAGDDLDMLAELSDLETLLNEEGASPTDQTNPLTSVPGVESAESEAKIGTDDKGGAKSASSDNIFSNFVYKLNKEIDKK